MNKISRVHLSAKFYTLCSNINNDVISDSLDNLINNVYHSRTVAYKAIDDFIFMCKKYSFNLTSDCFIVSDAEKWFREGFDNPDEYLDYSAYIN